MGCIRMHLQSDSCVGMDQICGCDTFTRAYYAKNFGITDMPEFDVDPEPLPTTAVRAPVPAYSGLGTQEDSFGSLSSCFVPSACPVLCPFFVATPAAHLKH